MRLFFASLSLLLVLVASSCDSSSTIAPPDEWTLSACFSKDAPVAVFIGRAEIGCLSGASFYETALDTVGHLGGSLYFHTKGTNAILVMRNALLRAKTYQIDLLEGGIELLSDPGTIGSQIDELDPGRYLITDHFHDGAVSDTAFLSFHIANDLGVEQSGSIAIPGLGFILFRDSDYLRHTEESVHLFISTLLGEMRLLRFMHSGFRYEYVDISSIETPTAVAHTDKGDLLVLDEVSGSIYSVLDGLIEVANVGPPQDGRTFKTIEKGPGGRLYVYSNSGTTSEIYTIMPDFRLAQVLSIPHTIRAMHVNAERGLLCTREYNYPIAGQGEYTETITFYNIATEEMTEVTTTLAADKYELPQFGCL